MSATLVGCKWSTRRLREFVMAKHGIERAEELFRDIENIFIKSLTSVQKIIINDKCATRIFTCSNEYDAELFLRN